MTPPRLNLIGKTSTTLCYAGSGASGTYSALASNCLDGLGASETNSVCMSGNGNSQPSAGYNCVATGSGAEFGWCSLGNDFFHATSSCSEGLGKV